MFTIGIDIGGSNIKFVLLRIENGKKIKILQKKRIPTPEKKSEIIEVLKREIKNFISEKKNPKIEGIGIAIASPLNKKGDLILDPPNLPCLKNCRLAEILKKDFKNIPIVSENDVNCFTLAEALIGAGQKAKTIFGITLGSGIGGGIVVNGKIYRGAFGGAGEVGHTIIKFDGPKCKCGNFGCLEEYCSIRFFKRKKTIPRFLEKKIRKGDKNALKIFKEYGKNLGIGLSNVINLLDPEMIIIGGGISKAYKFFLTETKKEIQKRVVSPLSKKNVKIKISKLKDFTGAVGAALLVNFKIKIPNKI